MLKTNGIAAFVAASMIFAGIPAAQAQSVNEVQPAPVPAPTTAEKIRQLDIMLMVSSLRCRHGAYDFQPAYGRFTTRHLSALNQANREITAAMAVRFGAQLAKDKVRRFNVRLANQYGLGHPWLGCAELARVTIDLADFGSDQELEAAANYLLGSAPLGGSNAMVAARQ